MKRLFYINEKESDDVKQVYKSDNHDVMIITGDLLRISSISGYIELRKEGKNRYYLGETTKSGILIELIATVYDDRKTVALETIICL